MSDMVSFRKAFWEKAQKERGIEEGMTVNLGDLASFDGVALSEVVSDSVLESLISKFGPRLDHQYYLHTDESERSVYEFEWGKYCLQFIEWACGYYMTVIAEDKGQKYVRRAFVDLFRGDWMMKDDYADKPEWIGSMLELKAKSSAFCKEHGVKG